MVLYELQCPIVSNLICRCRVTDSSNETDFRLELLALRSMVYEFAILVFWSSSLIFYVAYLPHTCTLSCPRPVTELTERRRTTWGPKLGLRQMCQARYSFGLVQIIDLLAQAYVSFSYYGAIVPSVLNCLSMLGFMVLNCILGGQTLSSVSDGRLNWE